MIEVALETNREPTVSPHTVQSVRTSEGETLEGCATSSGGSDANALRHGLAAAKHFPRQIELRSAETLARLIAERHPKTELERLVLMDLARRSATLEFLLHCETSALIVGSRNARKIAEATLPPQFGGEVLDVS